MADLSPTERPRFWSPGMIAVCAAGVFVIVLSLLWATLNYTARRSVERELTAIRARGEPTTLEELAPPEIPGDENAAVVLQAAFAELDARGALIESDADLERWEYEPLDPFGPVRVKIEKVVAEFAEPVQLAREALKRPGCRFDLDYSAGFEMELGHLAGLRRLARVLRASAVLHAHEGRIDAAVRDVVTILRLSQTLEEPVLISKLVMVAVHGIGLDALGSVEKAVELPDEARRLLIAELSGAKLSSHLRAAMIGERVFGSAAFGSIVSGDMGAATGLPPGMALPARFLRPYLRKDHARYLGIMTELADAAGMPPWEAVRETDGIMKRFEAVPRWRALVCQILLPALSAAANRLARAEAQRDACVLALALDLHRSAHGRYPDSLESLAPEFLNTLPPDPFTGKSFLYENRPDGSGFVVYSVGENGTDDGGAFDWETGDIPWTRAPRGAEQAQEVSGPEGSGGPAE